MNNDITRQVAIAAQRSLLAESAALWHVSVILLLGALAIFWILISGAIAGSGLLVALLAGSIAAGIIALYSGFRVRLDAALFALLDLPGTACVTEFGAGIDRFRARLAEHDGAGDDLERRLAGALRWWRVFIAALAAQLCLLLIATGVACLDSACYL